MKTFTLMIAGLSIAAAAVPTVASAQNYGGWQSIGARQANLDRRIDQGIRNRSLTRAEATRLRNEYRQIVRLEGRYRANGLSIQERRDLDRRYDALSSRIRYERNDRNDHRGRR